MLHKEFDEYPASARHKKKRIRSTSVSPGIISTMSSINTSPSNNALYNEATVSNSNTPNAQPLNGAASPSAIITDPPTTRLPSNSNLFVATSPHTEAIIINNLHASSAMNDPVISSSGDLLRQTIGVNTETTETTDMNIISIASPTIKLSAILSKPTSTIPHLDLQNSLEV